MVFSDYSPASRIATLFDVCSFGLPPFCNTFCRPRRTSASVRIPFKIFHCILCIVPGECNQFVQLIALSSQNDYFKASSHCNKVGGYFSYVM